MAYASTSRYSTYVVRIDSLVRDTDAISVCATIRRSLRPGTLSPRACRSSRTAALRVRGGSWKSSSEVFSIEDMFDRSRRRACLRETGRCYCNVGGTTLSGFGRTSSRLFSVSV